LRDICHSAFNQPSNFNLQPVLCSHPKRCSCRRHWRQILSCVVDLHNFTLKRPTFIAKTLRCVGVQKVTKTRADRIFGFDLNAVGSPRSWQSILPPATAAATTRGRAHWYPVGEAF